VGAIGVFDYKDSDIGPFRETYFVILASSQPMKGFLKLTKLLRALRKHPTPKLYLYYYRVWSSTETAALMSQEIWGVPSTLSSIDIQASKSLQISLSSKGNPILNLKFGHQPKIPILFGHEIFANTLGPSKDNLISPVRSCGATKIGKFKKGDALEIYDTQTKELLESLEFKPLIKELGHNQRAVQFLPLQELSQ
jgi:hypothetical protein